MGNIIEFKLPPGRRPRKDRRIKINLDYEQLAALDAEAAKRRCSRSAVIGTYLAELIERRKRAHS